MSIIVASSCLDIVGIEHPAFKIGVVDLKKEREVVGGRRGKGIAWSGGGNKRREWVTVRPLGINIWDLEGTFR